MLSAADEPEACAAKEDVWDETSSKAEPYRMGRRLLIGSAGPTMSAPGRAVKRADRCDSLADEEEEVAVDEEAGEEADDDDAKVRHASRLAAARMRVRVLVIEVSVEDDMLIDVTVSRREDDKRLKQRQVKLKKGMCIAQPLVARRLKFMCTST